MFAHAEFLLLLLFLFSSTQLIFTITLIYLLLTQTHLLGFSCMNCVFRYNLLFFVSGGGKFNYQGTKRWLEDNLDHTGAVVLYSTIRGFSLFVWIWLFVYFLNADFICGCGILLTCRSVLKVKTNVLR